MKQPYWRFILSHIIPFSIEKVKGTFNEYLEVIYSKGRYQLATENAIHSYEDMYTNYGEAFEMINIGQRAITETLLLGLGLGSIPLILEKKFELNTRYTAVELDEQVIYLANKYILGRLHSPFEFINTDAYLYVLQCQQTFDLICIDLFIDDKIPEQILQEDFLSAAKELVNENGILLFNVLPGNQTETYKRFYDDIFCTVFPDASLIKVHKSWMMINRKLYPVKELY